MTVITLQAPAFSSATTGPDAFYLRPNLNNSIAGPIDQCPDIIGASSAVADPQGTFGTSASWATAYPAVPPIGAEGYLYVRGCNGGTEPTVQQISLFAAPAQLIPWPSLWKTGVLTNAAGSDVTQLPKLAGGGIGVTPSAFVWTPPVLPPAFFYGAYAWATDTLLPAPAPSAATLADMAALLAQQPGLGISQIVTFTGKGPWIANVGLTIPASASDDTTILLTLGGSGLNGATVGIIGTPFTSQKTAIYLAPTTLPPNTTQGISITPQPGYSGILTLQVWPGAELPVDGAAIVVTAAYKVPTAQVSLFAERGALSTRAVHLAIAAGLRHSEAGISPTALAVLGGFSVLFQT